MTTTHDFSSRALYDIYQVTVKFREKICGGFPKNPDLIKDWIKAGTGFDDKQTEVQTQEALKELTDTVTEKSWNTFKADKEKGIYIESRQIKALFKECATMLRFTKNKRGSKDLLQHGFEIKAMDGGQRHYLGRKEPDGNEEGPIHVQTPQGPRTALKKVDYCEGVELTFEIWVLKTHPADSRYLGEKDIVEMLTFGQEDGIGADRSQGMGKFDVTDFVAVQKVKVSSKDDKEDGETAGGETENKKKNKKPAPAATVEQN